MLTLKAEYNGKVFVPSETVNLPPGTKVEIVIPRPLRQPTADEDRQWQDVLNDLAATPPAFPTVDEAINVSRGRS
jgi:hypothetical protein